MNEAGRRTRPHYEGDPTLFRVMLRPKWIAAFAAALVVAGGFAGLGQWQLGHALSFEADRSKVTEQVTALAAAVSPGVPLTDQVAGRVFAASGEFVATDFGVVAPRVNGAETGAWLIGHLRTADAEPTHLAVAIGWAPDVSSALAALPRFEAEVRERQLAVVGRLMPPEGVVRPERGFGLEDLASMAPGQLVNLWHSAAGETYAGYLVLHPSGSAAGAALVAEALADSRLQPIDSVPPVPAEKVNWLNVFYAAEWAVFAGFAVFFWVRLVRDDWERAHEALRLQSETTLSDAKLGE